MQRKPPSPSVEKVVGNKKKKKLVNKGADVTRKRSWMDNIYKTIYISKDTSQKLTAKG